MLIYLSGPMSGHPDYNYPAFNAAARRIRSLGHAVFNPAETFGGATDLSRRTYLEVDYAAVAKADALVYLPDADTSVGASTEIAIARSLGIPTWTFRNFLAEQGAGRLIGLCGYAGSGKDAVASVLMRDLPPGSEFTRIAFADELKNVARGLGWDGRKDDDGRRLLQNLGVAVRDCLGDSLWIDAALEGYNGDEHAVITDVRFANEMREIRGMGGEIWRVDRPGVGPVNDHVSEHEWTAGPFDRVIANDGTLDDLREKVLEALEPLGIFESADARAIRDALQEVPVDEMRRAVRWAG